MALRFVDGFDHYTPSTQGNRKWTLRWDTTGVAGVTAGVTGNCLKITGNNGSGRTIVPTGMSHATSIIGGHIYMSGLGRTDNIIVQWLENSGLVGHVTMRYETGEVFKFYRDNTTLLATSPAGIYTQGTWAHIEVKVVVHDTAGSITLKINGVTQLTATSLDTRNANNGLVDSILLNHPANNGGSAETRWDNFYICDGSGSTNNDFLGEVIVETLYPDGNGNSSQLDGSDGNTTNNYQLVDEAQPNDATDYVESATVGNKDTYTYANLATATGTVYGVQINPNATKSSPGTTRSAVTVARLSGTETDSASFSPGSAVYQDFWDVRETKPGGGAYSISDVNSSEFGLKIA